MAVSYSSKRSFESTLYPGVTITLHKVTERRRADLFRQLAPLTEKQRAISKKFVDIGDRGKLAFDTDEAGNKKPRMNPQSCEQEKEYSPEDMIAMTDLLLDRDSFEALEVNPVYLRWGVSSIDGLEIDGRPATVDDLIGDDCPDGLVKEILDVLSGKVDLDAESKKKSPLPCTTDEAEPQPIQAMSAEPVEMPETLQEETAVASI